MYLTSLPCTPTNPVVVFLSIVLPSFGRGLELSCPWAFECHGRADGGNGAACFLGEEEYQRALRESLTVSSHCKRIPWPRMELGGGRKVNLHNVSEHPCLKKRPAGRSSKRHLLHRY